MDIWLDTTEEQTIQQAVRLGLLSGVTTNPTLIAESGFEMEELLLRLLHYQEGPVTAQVVADEVEEMVQQGQHLHSLSNRFIIKVPITRNGLEAIHLLSRQGIPTMATALFHPQQALMAAIVGADYIAPYLGRLEKAGGDPWAMLKSTLQIFHHHRLKTKILGASLQSLEHIVRCAESGIHAVTLKKTLFENLIDTDALTTQAVEQFNNDWQRAGYSFFTYKR